MSVGLGWKSFVKIVKESSYGGPEEGFPSYIPFLNESIKTTITPIISAGIYGGFSRKRWKAGSIAISGTLTLEAEAKEQHILWRSLFGNVMTTELVANKVWKHTYTLASNLPSFKMEIRRDMYGIYEDFSFYYSGCKITNLDLTSEINNFVNLAFGIVAKEESIELATTPSIEENIPIFNFTEGEFAIGATGTVYPITAFRLSINNQLAVDRRALFSRTIREPVRNAPIEVTGTIDVEWGINDNDQLIYEAYMNYIQGAESKISITFNGPNIAGTPYNHQLKLILNRIFYTGDTPVVAGPGIIPVSIPFTALYDVNTSTAEIKAELINNTIAD
ncbi:MAG: phage tail tube protein [Thermoplasmata archaeon]